MARLPNLLFCALCTFNIVLIQAQQQIFKDDARSPASNQKFLAQFVINPSTPSAQQVLGLAQAYDLDVWHATPHTVDIYTSSIPLELDKLPHTVIPIPPHSITVTYNHSALPDWNVTTLLSPFHEAYHPISEIYDFYDQLVAKFPDMTRIVEIGRTAEGRSIFGISLSTGVYGGGKNDVEEIVPQSSGKRKKDRGHGRPPIRDTEKLGFVIIGAQHAREWIATSTAIYLAHSLLINQTEPNSLHRLLDHFDFHFVPVPNPDGYAYTWQTDRYWYKNRQVLGPYTRCVGLDMNRNWGHKWRSKVNYYKPPDDNYTNNAAPPVDPCSHWYPGSRPFQSPEVNSLANWITSLPNLAAFIDLRSFGQMLSSPYSYSCTKYPKDMEDQTEAALGSSHALSSVHGTTYQVGRLCETLYPAPGNVLDWMYAKESIKYAYVAHLRDTGTYGFSLPEKWIRPTGEETNQMVNYLSRFIARQTNRRFMT